MRDAFMFVKHRARFTLQRKSANVLPFTECFSKVTESYRGAVIFV